MNPSIGSGQENLPYLDTSTFSNSLKAGRDELKKNNASDQKICDFITNFIVVNQFSVDPNKRMFAVKVAATLIHHQGGPKLDDEGLTVFAKKIHELGIQHLSTKTQDLQPSRNRSNAVGGASKEKQVASEKSQEKAPVAPKMSEKASVAPKITPQEKATTTSLAATSKPAALKAPSSEKDPKKIESQFKQELAQFKSSKDLNGLKNKLPSLCEGIKAYSTSIKTEGKYDPEKMSNLLSAFGEVFSLYRGRENREPLKKSGEWEVLKGALAQCKKDHDFMLKFMPQEEDDSLESAAYIKNHDKLDFLLRTFEEYSQTEKNQPKSLSELSYGLNPARDFSTSQLLMRAKEGKQVQGVMEALCQDINRFVDLLKNEKNEPTEGNFRESITYSLKKLVDKLKDSGPQFRAALKETPLWNTISKTIEKTILEAPKLPASELDKVSEQFELKSFLKKLNDVSKSFKEL